VAGLVTLLHPPYTAWHLSYVVIGAALAPRVLVSNLIATVLAFFLAVGLAAHALDELRGPSAADGHPVRSAGSPWWRPACWARWYLACSG